MTKTETLTLTQEELSLIVNEFLFKKFGGHYFKLQFHGHTTIDDEDRWTVCDHDSFTCTASREVEVENK